MPNIPFISIIIPVHNGGQYLERCLDALIESSWSSFEIIVVDDCSTDDTVTIAQQKRITILQLSGRSGASVARNFGAQHARGNILLFIDSDILVKRETIKLVADGFQQHTDIAAIFGSYDDNPQEENFMSQYRNLFHHFNHQNSDTEASTFWTGCGAIRKNVFEEIGEFRDSFMEDIELGYRLREKGYRIFLDKGLQVKHLKQWKFLSMLRADIFKRAIPWSRLILETGFMPKELNLQPSHKASSVSVALMISVVPFLFFGRTKFFNIPVVPAAGFFLSILFVNFLILNRELYGFYARKKGLRFMAQVIPLHFLYYLYSGISFVACWVSYKLFLHRPPYHMTEKYNAGTRQKT